MTPYPNYPGISKRLRAVKESAKPYAGTVYRFISPKFSTPADVTSGLGGLHAAGRWNLKGAHRISYTSLTPETALAESLAHVRYFNLPLPHALPRTLVSINVQLSKTLDLSEGRLRQRLQLGIDTIQKHNWRTANQQLKEATTQAWGRCFFEEGYEAILIPSAASPGNNLIVLPENLNSESLFETIP
ncbi:RES family NAD+ phosphorylase [Puniceicoccaceae bacterium K14]|nr:RES family NAD+ phosphorylase [Puniceicoccaceae bacterium K14]